MVEPSVDNKEKYKPVIVGQKIIIFTILLHFVLIIMPPPFPALIFLFIFCVIFSLTGFFELVKVLKMYRFFKILYVFVLFMPLLNMLALVLLNAAATKILKNNGYHVGLMGAKLIKH